MTTAVQQPVVQTCSGAVRGTAAHGIYVFKGIPYAVPPFGANRLRPPQPVPPWSGVRDAFSFGPTPPQLPSPGGLDALIPNAADVGEDCLNLNIWSPELAPASRPVMVWIAGGAFESGTGASMMAASSPATASSA